MENGASTTMGRRLLSLPAHPRLARLLLAAAEEGLLHEGAALAGLLAEKDIATIDYDTHPHQRGPATQGPSDLLIRLEMLQRAEKSNFAGHLRSDGIDSIAA